jgi:hypothetical protein
MITVYPRWRQVLSVWGVACVLTLFVGSACGDTTGPPNTPQPDETDEHKGPPEPEGQGFLLVPPGSQGFLV